MRPITLLAGCALAGFPNLVQAAVYSGCSAPSLKPSHHTFYVDPQKGSAKGDGSLARPWRTLAEVVSNKLIATKGHNERTWRNGDTALVDVNANGPIKPGDVVMLMSGDHGAVTLSNMYNPDFITIMAAPGQTPTLSRLLLTSVGKWNFQGLQIIGQKPSGYQRVDGLATIGYSEWVGSTNDVVMLDMTFMATKNTGSWSPTDWINLPYAYAVYINYGSTCSSVSNSHIDNAYNGIAIGGTQVLIQDNIVEHMTNDGIDIYASDVSVVRNTVRNGMNTVTSTDHADGIQGWSVKQNGADVVNRNVRIDSNLVTKSGPRTTSYMQGITIFDGLWDNLLIVNNAVVTNAYHGLTVSGVKSGSLVNNTVLGSDPQTGTWMMVNGGSGSVTLRNNVASSIIINGTGTTDDHNVVASQGNYSKTDKYDPSLLSKFVTFNTTSRTYDLRPKVGSSVIGFGSRVDAPAIDISGKARLPSVSAGAYN